VRGKEWSRRGEAGEVGRSSAAQMLDRVVGRCIRIGARGGV